MLFFVNATPVFRTDKIHYCILFQNKKKCVTKHAILSGHGDTWSEALSPE